MECLVFVTCIICVVLNIVLYCYLLGAASHIIKWGKVRNKYYIKLNEIENLLKIYHSPNNSNFDSILYDAIYYDLHNEFYNSENDYAFAEIYRYWKKTCDKYNWNFPESLKDCLTCSKFKEKFYHN